MSSLKLSETVSLWSYQEWAAFFKRNNDYFKDPKNMEALKLRVGIKQGLRNPNSSFTKMVEQFLASGGQ